MAKGRPKKVELTNAELIEKANRHEAMTLDEAARLMGSAYYERTDPKTGQKVILEPKQYSVMGFQKFEQRTLLKLRNALAAKGIKNLDDILPEHGFNMPGKVENTKEY